MATVKKKPVKKLAVKEPPVKVFNVYTVSLTLSVYATDEEDAYREFERRCDKGEWDSGSVDCELEKDNS